MRISISVKLNNRKLRKVTPNVIYEYAELVEILREHGFLHRTCLDIGFTNDNATMEDAKNTLLDAAEKLGWLEDCLVEWEAVELGETEDWTAVLKKAAAEADEQKSGADGDDPQD